MYFITDSDPLFNYYVNSKMLTKIKDAIFNKEKFKGVLKSFLKPVNK